MRFGVWSGGGSSSSKGRGGGRQERRNDRGVGEQRPGARPVPQHPGRGFLLRRQVNGGGVAAGELAATPAERLLREAVPFLPQGMPVCVPCVLVGGACGCVFFGEGM